MFLYWTMRFFDAIGWLILLAAVIVMPATFVFLDHSDGPGTLTAWQTVLAEGLLVVVLAAGYVIRIGSRAGALEQVAVLKGARLSFVGAPSLHAFRWLAEKSGGRLFRFLPPSTVNVVATDAGLEFYWPLQSAPMHLVATMRWREIAGFSSQPSSWRPDKLTIVLNAGHEIRFRLARTSFDRARGRSIVESLQHSARRNQGDA